MCMCVCVYVCMCAYMCAVTFIYIIICAKYSDFMCIWLRKCDFLTEKLGNKFIPDPDWPDPDPK
jgi:hypothetical protein